MFRLSAGFYDNFNKKISQMSLYKGWHKRKTGTDTSGKWGLVQAERSGDVPVPVFRVPEMCQYPFFNQKGLTPTFVQCNETNSVVYPIEQAIT